MTRYAKFLVAALAAGGVTLQAAISDGVITGDEWWKVALAAGGAVLVLAVPNKQDVPSAPTHTPEAGYPSSPSPSKIEQELPEVRSKRGRHEM